MGFIIAFVLQTQVCIEAKLYVLLAGITAGMIGYFAIEINQRRRKRWINSISVGPWQDNIYLYIFISIQLNFFLLISIFRVIIDNYFKWFQVDIVGIFALFMFSIYFNNFIRRTLVNVNGWREGTAWKTLKISLLIQTQKSPTI